MIRSYAAGFIFTTSLPPTVLAGAYKAISILASDEGRVLRGRHQDNVKYLRGQLLKNGFPVRHTPSHIIPIKIGNPLQCGAVCDTLLKEKGHYIQAINYPTVAKGEELLRLAPTPHHTKLHMDTLVNDLKEVWQELNLPFTGLQCEKVTLKNLFVHYLILFIYLAFFQECKYCQKPILFDYLESRSHKDHYKELMCNIPNCPQLLAVA